MATLSTNDILHNSVAIFTGPAGSTASVPAGFIDDEGVVNVFYDVQGILKRFQGNDLPRAVFSRAKEFRLTVPITQINDIDLLVVATGNAKSGSTITIGDPTKDTRLTQISVAMVGQSTDGTVFRIDIFYCVVTSGLDFGITQSESSTQDVIFMATHPADGSSFPLISRGTGNTAVTLDGAGDLVITAGYHLITGNGGASDTWATFSGLVSGDDGSEFVFQAASSGHAITVNHVAGVIELFGGVGDTFVMGGSANALKNEMHFVYDDGNTKLIEYKRLDEVARQSI